MRGLAVADGRQAELDGVEHEGDVDAVVAEARVDVAPFDEREHGRVVAVRPFRTRGPARRRPRALAVVPDAAGTPA